MSGIEAMRFSIILYLLHLCQSSRHIGVAQLIEQFIHIFRRLCHSLVERFLRIGLLTEQFSQCQTCIDNLHNDTGVVKLAAYTLRRIGHVELTADITIVKVLHHRNGRRRLEVKQPTIKSFLLCIGTQNGLRVVIQPCQKRLICNKHRPCIGCLKYILAILQCQLTQFSSQFAIHLLVFRREIGAVISKTLVYIFQQFLLCLVQFEFSTLVIHRFDTQEETFV